MRIMLASVMVLAACGAESPSGPIPTTDAATDTAPAPADATQGMCLEPRIVIYTGACVSHTDTDCAGRTCPTGEHCIVSTLRPPDAGLHVSAGCAPTD